MVEMDGIDTVNSSIVFKFIDGIMCIYVSIVYLELENSTYTT